jgi:transposase
LARLGDKRLQCSEEQLVDASTGTAQPMHWEMMALQLERQSMKPHQEAVMRLAEVPGLGVDSAQQIIAEVGVQASTFPSAAELISWWEPVPEKTKMPNRTTARWRLADC